MLFAGILIGFISGCNCDCDKKDGEETAVAATETASMKSVEAKAVEMIEVSTIDKITEFPISWDQRGQKGYYHICVRTDTDKGKTLLKLKGAKGYTESELEIGADGVGLSCYVRANGDTVLVVDPRCVGCPSSTEDGFAIKVSDIGAIGAHNFEIVPHYKYAGSGTDNLCIIGMDDARDGNYTGASPSNGFYAEFRDITLARRTVIKLSYDLTFPVGTNGSMYLTARYLSSAKYNDKDQPAGTTARSKPVIDWTCN